MNSFQAFLSPPRPSPPHKVSATITANPATIPRSLRVMDAPFRMGERSRCWRVWLASKFILSMTRRDARGAPDLCASAWIGFQSCPAPRQDWNPIPRDSPRPPPLPRRRQTLHHLVGDRAREDDDADDEELQL